MFYIRVEAKLDNGELIILGEQTGIVDVKEMYGDFLGFFNNRQLDRILPKKSIISMTIIGEIPSPQTEFPKQSEEVVE